MIFDFKTQNPDSVVRFMIRSHIFQIMRPEEFKDRQKRLGFSNKKLAKQLHITAQQVSNYRTGLRPIPLWVQRVIRLTEEVKYLKQRNRELILENRELFAANEVRNGSDR